MQNCGYNGNGLLRPYRLTTRHKHWYHDENANSSYNQNKQCILHAYKRRVYVYLQYNTAARALQWTYIIDIDVISIWGNPGSSTHHQDTATKRDYLLENICTVKRGTLTQGMLAQSGTISTTAAIAIAIAIGHRRRRRALFPPSCAL